MHCLRAAIVLAIGQVTPMHCVRAVIALAIAITFPQMAYAQTIAIQVIVSPVGDTTPATNVPSCTPASCQKLVPRYPKARPTCSAYWLLGDADDRRPSDIISSVGSTNYDRHA